MLAPNSGEHLPSWLRASSLHISQPLLKVLDRLDAIQKLLIGFGVLNNDFGPSVDRQDQRVAGFLETVEEFRRISFEVAERSNVVGNVQHGSSPNLHRI